jgi:hypothetical protein
LLPKRFRNREEKRVFLRDCERRKAEWKEVEWRSQSGTQHTSTGSF